MFWQAGADAEHRAVSPVSPHGPGSACRALSWGVPLSWSIPLSWGVPLSWGIPLSWGVPVSWGVLPKGGGMLDGDVLLFVC